jgi:hypothetical protein
MNEKEALLQPSLNRPVRGEEGVQTALDVVKARSLEALPVQASLYEVSNLSWGGCGRLHVHLSMHLPLDDLFL